MAEFISKLQYKTYEKGEFSDEKVRSLEETLQLIKSFPWDEQRGSDVQLTGPSVTIQNDYVEYLKLGLYFNGKFCLYFYDRNDHLFELHEPTLEDAYQVITDFFNGLPIEEKFDKHFFSIGSKSHLETKYFTYRVSLINVLMLSFFLITLFVIFSVFTIAIATTKAPFIVIAVPMLLAILLGWLLVYIFTRYSACSDQVLEISKGNSIFSFGNNGDEQTYNKTDIKEIVQYVPGGGRNPNMFYVFEIYFKDGSIIKFSNMLISDITFTSKFSNDLFVLGKKNPLWLL
jgi:hypothetical protein